MTPLKVGIIGCGRIADLHIQGYRGQDDALVTAICDEDQSTLARRAEEWRCSKTFADYRDLLADPEIDLVEVLTPHDLHCRMVCDAARAKKHVSVQKPMAVNLHECNEMIRACLFAGVQLKVYENFVFYPPFVAARSLIEEGEIGEILTVRIKLGSLGGGWHVPLAAWLWRLDRRRAGPGPTLFDDGYHKFSMAVDLLGEVASVRGWVDSTLGVIDSPSLVVMTFKKHPAIAYFETSFTPNAKLRSRYYGADERLEITGSKGRIRMTRCTGKLLDEPPLVLERNGRTIGFQDLRADWSASFVDSTRHFISAIRNYRAPKLSGETGRHILQVALAAFVASREGRAVDPANVTGEEIA